MTNVKCGAEDALKTTNQKLRPENYLKPETRNPAPEISLFLLALLPRIVGLNRIISGTEPAWFRQALVFWQAVADKNWQNTGNILAPGLSVLWGGGLGVWLSYLLQPTLPLSDWLAYYATSSVKMSLLLAARGVLILLICLGTVGLYRLLRGEMERRAAWGTAALLALAPVFVAQSRLLHPSALLAVLTLLALVLLHRSARGDDRALWGAGIANGLALATDWLALLLIPFAIAVFFWQPWAKTRAWWRQVVERGERLVFWLVLSSIMLVLLWPAAWENPLGMPVRAVTLVFRSAAGLPDVVALQNLLLALLFYGSPVTLAGLVLWPTYHRRLSPTQRRLTILLGSFVLAVVGWAVFFRQDIPGALLPAVVILPVVAAIGWQSWLSPRSVKMQRWGWGILVVLQGLVLLPLVPYYSSYANPLLGGPKVAAHQLPMDKGMAMDRIGAWLNQQPDALAGVVGVDTPDLLAPFYVGRLATVDAPDLAYVVITQNQRQREKPSPTILRYYDRLMEPARVISVAGLDVAWIYRGPAVQRALALPVGLETGLLPRPLAFRLATDAPRPNDNLTVDVVWLPNPAQPEVVSVLSLRAPIKFKAGNDTDDNIALAASAIYAEAPAPLQQVAAGLVVSRHTLRLPADLPAGTYGLMVDARPLGNVTVSNGQAD